MLTTTDPNNNVTTNTYDPDGNLRTTKDPKGDLTTKTYDADNELTSSVVTSPTNVTVRSQSTTYDADGNVATQVNGDNKTTTYAYDPLNREMSVTDPLNRTTSYTYDPAGNPLTITDPQNREHEHLRRRQRAYLGDVLRWRHAQRHAIIYDPDGSALDHD